MMNIVKKAKKSMLKTVTDVAVKASTKSANTDTKNCKPSVGSPTADISVNYKVSASTPTSNDVFWTKGNITKIS